MKRLVILVLWIALAPSSAFALPMRELTQLEQRWEQAYYALTDEDAKEQEFQAVLQQADKLIQAHSQQAEPYIWRAIALSSLAGLAGPGFDALKLAEASRDALLQAESLNPTAMGGAIYYNLGALYFHVPGWPIGFGSNKQAREYFEKAVAIAPDNPDALFFYGEYLFDQGQIREAHELLRQAENLLDKPERSLIENHRLKEIKALLEKIEKRSVRKGYDN